MEMETLLVILVTASLLPPTTSSEMPPVCSAISLPSCHCTDNAPPFTTITTTTNTFANVRCEFNTTNPPARFFNSSLESSVSVHSLDLSDNDLDDLPDDFFDGLMMIDTLILRGNRFTDVPAVLGKLGGLRALDLSSNALGSLSWEMLEDVSGLQSLDVSGNQLTSLSAAPAGPIVSMNNVTGMMTSLRELKAAGNVIASIEDGALDQTPGLLSLDLSGNKLTQLTRTTFRTALSESLQSLDLSGNPLTAVDTLSLRPLRRLQALSLAFSPLGPALGPVRVPQHLSSLDLRGCGLTALSRCQFSALTDLTVLDVRDNPLNCTCDLYQLYQRFHTADSGVQNQWTCRPMTVSMSTPSPSSTPTSPVPSESEVPLADLHSQCQDSYAVCPSLSELVSQMETTLEVHTSGDSNLRVTWTLDEVSEDLAVFLDGFQLHYIPEGSHSGDVPRTITSDVLPPEQRTLTMETGADLTEHFVVCLDVLVSGSTSVVHQQCRTVQGSPQSSILVGILAGLVFLIPCAIVMAVIYFKDSRITRAFYVELASSEVDAENQPAKVVEVSSPPPPGKSEVVVSISDEKNGDAATAAAAVDAAPVLENKRPSGPRPTLSKKEDGGVGGPVQSTAGKCEQVSEAVASAGGSSPSAATSGHKAEDRSVHFAASARHSDKHSQKQQQELEEEEQEPSKNGGIKNLGFQCQAGHAGDKVCSDPEHESTNM